MTAPALDTSVDREDYEHLKVEVKTLLEEAIASDETIKVIIRASQGGQAMIGTERRVFVCKPGSGRKGAKVTPWSYRDLLGVQTHKAFSTGTVALNRPGKSQTSTSYWKQQGDDAIAVPGQLKRIEAGVTRLRELIDAAHGPDWTPPPLADEGYRGPPLDSSVDARAYERLKPKVRAAVEETLAPNETVKVIVEGAHGQAMIGTEGRVIVCKPGFMAGASFGAEVTTWGYQNLLGVQVHKGMVTGAVVLQGPGQTGTKTSYWGREKDDPKNAPNAIPVAGDWEQVQAGVARLRQLIDDAHGPAVVAQATAPSIADELRKLADLRADGVISEGEFETAKSRLLSG